MGSTSDPFKTTIHLQAPEFPDDPLKTDRRLINPVLFIGHLQIPQNWQVIYSNEAIYHKNNQIDLRFCPPICPHFLAEKLIVGRRIENRGDKTAKERKIKMTT